MQDKSKKKKKLSFSLRVGRNYSVDFKNKKERNTDSKFKISRFGDHLFSPIHNATPERKKVYKISKSYREKAAQIMEDAGQAFRSTDYHGVLKDISSWYGKDKIQLAKKKKSRQRRRYSILANSLYTKR